MTEQVTELAYPTDGGPFDRLSKATLARLAVDAWGAEAIRNENGPLTAMAYLWRRFGPPWHGGDDRKEVEW